MQRDAGVVPADSSTKVTLAVSRDQPWDPEVGGGGDTAIGVPLCMRDMVTITDCGDGLKHRRRRCMGAPIVLGPLAGTQKPEVS